jgi:hypothetical protein
MDPELRRRATPSEQRQHDDEMRGDDKPNPHAECEDDPCPECIQGAVDDRAYEEMKETR